MPLTRRGPRALATVALLVVSLSATVAAPATAVSVKPTGASASARARAALVKRNLDDLVAWWAVEMPRRYRMPFEALSGYVGYTSERSARPPRCGDEDQPDYDDEADNAYYCPDGDFIAWDDESLLPQLYRDYGPIAIGMVLAHEMGHAVQARAEVDLDRVGLELQADCFAGAWLQRVTTGAGSGDAAAKGALRYDFDKIDDAVHAMATFSDDPGGLPDDENAHGSAFDRVSALQVGFESGVARCVAFEQRPPTVTLAPFSSAAEERNGGDLPLGETLTTIRPIVADWWRTTDRRMPTVVLRGSTAAGVKRIVRACDGVLVFEGVTGVCPPEDDGGAATIAYDAAEVRRVHHDDGDFAVATVLAQSWSTLWQAVTGRVTADRTQAAEQQATCATGAWIRSLGRVGGSGGLSPGDLDESIYAILDLPGPSSAFEAIAALRAGHTRGMRACR